MTRCNWLFATLAVLALFGAGLAGSTKARADAGAEDGVTVTQRTMTLRDGRRLPYTARAGYLPLVNDATNETTAHVYFVAYTVAPSKNAQPRALTFVFPGGPGTSRGEAARDGLPCESDWLSAILVVTFAPHQNVRVVGQQIQTSFA